MDCIVRMRYPGSAIEPALTCSMGGVKTTLALRPR